MLSYSSLIPPPSSLRSSLLFVEAFDEVEVLAPVKSVGVEIIYQVAVVPVDHRIDDRDTGARELSKQLVHQRAADALSMIVRVNADDLQPARELRGELPAAHISQNEADDAVAVLCDETVIGRARDIGGGLRFVIGGVRLARDLLVKAQHLIYVA